MLRRILVVVTIFSGVLLFVLLNTTAPTDVGPAGVLIFFILLYLVCLGAITALLRLMSYLAVAITKGFVLAHPLKQLSIKKSYYLSSVLALAPILLLAIQSFGGIGFLEFGLVILFSILGCIFVSKR